MIKRIYNAILTIAKKVTERKLFYCINTSFEVVGRYFAHISCRYPSIFRDNRGPKIEAIKKQIHTRLVNKKNLLPRASQGNVYYCS